MKTLKLKVSLGLLAALLLMSVVSASGRDLHAMWDDRCATCHGHSGEFSRRVLSVSNAELQGRHHIHDLRLFLTNHYLSGHSVEPVYNMLLAQASSKPRFKDECSKCHQSAAEFSRKSLILRDGELYDRSSDIPIRDFLSSHRKLQPGDVDYFLQQLIRVTREVNAEDGTSK